MVRTNGTSCREQIQGDSQATGGETPRSVEVASCGLRSTQDFKDLGAALAEDILAGTLSHKVAGPVVRSVLMTVRVAEYEQRSANGQSVELADSRRPKPGKENEQLAKRRAELLEELAAIDKERAAQ